LRDNRRGVCVKRQAAAENAVLNDSHLKKQYTFSTLSLSTFSRQLKHFYFAPKTNSGQWTGYHIVRQESLANAKVQLQAALLVENGF